MLIVKVRKLTINVNDSYINLYTYNYVDVEEGT